MKHILKKFSAFALAFTILGVGSVLTRTVSPKSDNTLTAYATTCNNCHGGSYYIRTRFIEPCFGGYIYEEYCGLCGKTLGVHFGH
ncbi:MAG: hypothetical protein IKH96_04160 [Ruminococcus sp.]|uniref:hypothetical protein n=1 Tax=Ruminococcus sp. TaxID=41978 RepID=UPI0025F56C3F|nr:hypothetical protein [Ruminococcus sp.]MBR6995194.1 hypothetical protein [Ruminococcus sp.]